jgi:hypothetical protein
VIEVSPIKVLHDFAYVFKFALSDMGIFKLKRTDNAHPRAHPLGLAVTAPKRFVIDPEFSFVK